MPAARKHHRFARREYAGVDLGDEVEFFHAVSWAPMSEPSPTEILLSQAQIQKRVAELAAEIRRDFPGDLHVIAVLKGAFVFLSDLIRAMPGHVSLDFMAVSSYAKGTTSSGEVRLLKDLDTSLDGRHVVIVEDIVDTGLTLLYLQEILRARNPRSLRTACLLSKPSRRQVDVKVDYIGFTIEDRFVVGYGLDYAEQYRNLPHIAVLRG
jgi:hypoxanthine phosphoribosyltransferase